MKNRLFLSLVPISCILFLLLCPCNYQAIAENMDIDSATLLPNTYRFHTSNLNLMADSLDYLGLFKGTTQGYELERNATRMEALVTIIRLIGQEKQAQSSGLVSSFEDVPNWATSFAGFGQQQGLIQGITHNSLGADNSITAGQYTAMILRVLGYHEQNGDFKYEEAVSFACKIGLIDVSNYDHIDKTLTRGDLVYFMLRALSSNERSSNTLLMYKLIADGVITTEHAYGSMLARGEKSNEITRALINGYQEKWALDAQKAISNNLNIPPDFKPIFSDCIYRWLKESGTHFYMYQIMHNLNKLYIEVKSPNDDIVLKNNDNIMAYFKYPNQIVVRHDLNANTSASAISHEFRHAMTNRLGITFLDEGFTECWNQEVDGGGPGYSYYYINISRIIIHLLGERTVNEAHLSGDHKELFANLRKVSGVSFDEDSFYDALSKLNQSNDYQNHLQAVQVQLLQLIQGYYQKNMHSLAMNADSYKQFADTLIALGQLLYYPSAMIQEVESMQIADKPEIFYSAAFNEWASLILIEYSNMTGCSLTTLTDYYRQQLNQRLCLKYFGQDTGKIFEKTGTAYIITFQHDKNYSMQAFGTQELAQNFQKRVKSINLEEKAGQAFKIREYHNN